MTPCPLPRRLAVIFYDGLLLVAVFFFATFALLPFMEGRFIENTNIFYKLFLLILAWLYFCWQWTNGGQTLGMRSWHVFIIDESENCPDWKSGTLRFIGALLSLTILGLGFIWSLFDKNRLTLHDHLSKTHLIIKKSQ